jgi:hypothetical protein
MTLEERLWARVQRTEDCWVWISTLQGDGYRYIKLDKQSGEVTRRANGCLVDLETPYNEFTRVKRPKSRWTASLRLCAFCADAKLNLSST